VEFIYIRQMHSLLKDKTLFYISLFISGYFLTLYLFYIFELKGWIIGFFGELLTIPIMLAQLIFLGVGIFRFVKIKEARNKWIITAVIILAISSILTIGSFFF